MQKESQRGFTIIEMFIVLAVAGLILSLIMLLIPTLQRNGRNNQRQQDVQTILGGVSHYALNNSGNFPDSRSFANGLKLSYYELGSIETQTRGPREAVVPVTTLDLDRVFIANHQKCEGNVPTERAAGYSDIVALYMIETGGNNTATRCVEL